MSLYKPILNLSKFGRDPLQRLDLHRNVRQGGVHGMPPVSFVNNGSPSFPNRGPVSALIRFRIKFSRAAVKKRFLVSDFGRLSNHVAGTLHQ
jgi:hypothetical protein